MAGIAVLACGARRPSRVGPDVCWLHAEVSILAIGDGLSGQVLHELLLTQHSPRVLDEEKSRQELLDQRESLLHYGYALQTSLVLGLALHPIVPQAGDRERGTGRRCPDDVRMPEFCGEHGHVEVHDVDAQVGFELWIDVHSEGLVS